MLNRVQWNLSRWSSKARKILDAQPDQIKRHFKKHFENKNTGASRTNQDPNQYHLNIARESLEYLLKDPAVPKSIRLSLRHDYQQVQTMLEKLQHEQIHIAALGRVSVGKSSLLNVLMGEKKFSVSPLHGETKAPELSGWKQYYSGNVFLIDTPGINEVNGEQRQRMALEVVSRADIILFIVDGDITDTEFKVLQQVSQGVQPVILVLNKADQYTGEELQQLLKKLRMRAQGYVDAEHIVAVRSQSSIKHYIRVDANGHEEAFTREQPADVEVLKHLLKNILEQEGKTLAAINAALFADRLSEQVNSRLMALQQEAADKLIHTYCLAKGVAVALNPVPVADLMTAAMVDIGMIYHLSRLYGLPMSKREAGELVKTIMMQVMLLMGTIWLVHVLSSALKLGTAGLSTLISASAQGAIAYYGTYVVGEAAKVYLKNGKTWGEKGPKYTIQKILEGIDRNSVIKQARRDIMKKIS